MFQFRTQSKIRFGIKREMRNLMEVEEKLSQERKKERKKERHN